MTTTDGSDRVVNRAIVFLFYFETLKTSEFLKIYGATVFVANHFRNELLSVKKGPKDSNVYSYKFLSSMISHIKICFLKS